jgi:chemotaxis protein MotB
VAVFSIADLPNNFTAISISKLINLAPYAYAADGSNYDAIVTEWQLAQKILKDALEIQKNIQSTNSKSEADIEKQIQSIATAEKALNESITVVAKAEQKLIQAENSQDDPLGEELKETLLNRQNELDAAILKTDAAKQDIAKSEASFLRVKSTTDQLVTAVAAADASAKAAKVVAQAAKSAQLAIAEIESDNAPSDPSNLLESGFVNEANQQAEATEKSANVARNVLSITQNRLQEATDALTEKQEYLVSVNKAVETAYSNFAAADKAFKVHDADQKVKIKKIQAEIQAATESVVSSQTTLEQNKQFLSKETLKLENLKTALATGQKMRSTLDTEVSTAQMTFNEVNVKLRRAQRARSERNAVILATLNADMHDRLHNNSIGKNTSPQIYNRFMMPADELFKSNGPLFSDTGTANIDKIAKLIDTIPNRIPKGVDWVLRVDAHAGGGGNAWDISQARALNIVKHIAANSSIPAERLSANAYGRFKTLDTGEDFKTIAPNGWVEITLSAR